MARILAAVLAAGASRRLGRPKQRAEIDGRPLVVRAFEAASGSAADAVVVVLGHRAAEIRTILPSEVEVVVNAGWDEGMASSVRAAIAHARTRSPPFDAVLLMVCDQVELDAATLDRLIVAFTRSGLPAAACEYDGVLGVPALFRRDLWQELEAIRGDRGAREVLRRDPARVATVPWPAGALDHDRGPG